MGAADLVPGISGGTIAFILGFYHSLIESLQTFNKSAFFHLFKGQWRAFADQIAWKFLLTLLAGIAVAFICFANFFHFILAHETYRVYLYSIFLGLIAASFVFCLRQIQAWSVWCIFGLVVGAASAYLLTDATLTPTADGPYAVEIAPQPTEVSLRNYNPTSHLLTELSAETLSALITQGVIQDNVWVYDQAGQVVGTATEIAVSSHGGLLNGWLILCGAIAICALLLPGISGSYLLTILGVYPIVIEAFVDFLNGLKQGTIHPEAFAILFSLGLGIAIGALSFARVLSWLMKRCPNVILSLLSGFMIGALRSVWPFWTYDYALMPLKLPKGPQLIPVHTFLPSWDNPYLWQSAGCVLVGFLLVFALEAIAKKKITSHTPQPVFRGSRSL